MKKLLWWICMVWVVFLPTVLGGTVAITLAIYDPELLLEILLAVSWGLSAWYLIRNRRSQA